MLMCACKASRLFRPANRTLPLIAVVQRFYASNTSSRAPSVRLFDCCELECDHPEPLPFGELPFWRAELSRVALFVGDVSFDDVRNVQRADLPRHIQRLCCPVMEVNGQLVSNTMQIALCSAHLASIQPADEGQDSQVKRILSASSALVSVIGSTGRLPEHGPDRAEALSRMCSPGGQLSEALAAVEALCAANAEACGRAVGSRLTVADLAIWRIAGGGLATVRGVPSDFVARSSPNVSAVLAAVEAEPKVQAWKALHPKYGGRDVYGF